MLTAGLDSLGKMAGLIAFNFAMDVCFKFAAGDDYSSIGHPSSFVMRDYGDCAVGVALASGKIDASCHDQVSSHGAGMLPVRTWVSVDSFNAGDSGEMYTSHNATIGEFAQMRDVKIVAVDTTCLVGGISELAPIHRSSLAGKGVRLNLPCCTIPMACILAAPEWPESLFQFSRYQDAVNAWIDDEK